MKSFSFTTLPAIAILCAGLAQSAWGQTVYRCGSRYSQSPCTGSVAVDVDDARTDAQRNAAKEGLARDKALGNEMETARHKDEADALARDKAVMAANAKAAARSQAEAKKQQHKKAGAKAGNGKKRAGSQGKQTANENSGVFTAAVGNGSAKGKSKSK